MAEADISTRARTGRPRKKTGVPENASIGPSSESKKRTSVPRRRWLHERSARAASLGLHAPQSMASRLVNSRTRLDPEPIAASEPFRMNPAPTSTDRQSCLAERTGPIIPASNVRELRIPHQSDARHSSSSTCCLRRTASRTSATLRCSACSPSADSPLSRLLAQVAVMRHLFGVTSLTDAATNVRYLLGTQALLYVFTFVGSLIVFPLVWHKSLFAGLQWRGQPSPAVQRVPHWSGRPLLRAWP